MCPQTETSKQQIHYWLMVLLYDLLKGTVASLDFVSQQCHQVSGDNSHFNIQEHAPKEIHR